jgi:hypothetical protein
VRQAALCRHGQELHVFLAAALLEGLIEGGKRLLLFDAVFDLRGFRVQIRQRFAERDDPQEND